MVPLGSTVADFFPNEALAGTGWKIGNIHCVKYLRFSSGPGQVLIRDEIGHSGIWLPTLILTQFTCSPKNVLKNL